MGMERERSGPRRQPILLIVLNDASFFLSHRLPVAEAAREEGFDVHVATPPAAAVAGIRDAGFTHHPIPLSRRGMRVWEEARSLTALVSLYRWLSPDVVHHFTVKPVLYGGLAARLARVPAVLHTMTGLGYVFVSRDRVARVLRPFVRAGYRVAFGHPRTRVVFQNPDDLAEFARRRIVRAEQSVLVRGSGIDPDVFTPLPEPVGEPVAVLAGRMLRDKGVAEFVDAARTLQARGVRARFALVGDTDTGNPAAIPRETLDLWVKEGAVEWWGWRGDMLRVFAGCHVVCLPSYGEGVPKVLIEAAACARPLVATDVPGCREIARHGTNGLLVPPRDARALADALEALLTDAALRARMGAAGRTIVLEEFTTAEVADRTLRVYRDLAGREREVVRA